MFQNGSSHILENMNENNDKRYIFGYHDALKRFMGYQIYVVLCSKITSFGPSEGEFSKKLGIFSKVKNFQNPSR